MHHFCSRLSDARMNHRSFELRRLWSRATVGGVFGARGIGGRGDPRQPRVRPDRSAQPGAAPRRRLADQLVGCVQQTGTQHQRLVVLHVDVDARAVTHGGE